MMLAVVKAKKTTLDHIQDLVAKLDPQIRRSFLASVKRIKDSVSLKDIQALLETGRVDEALGLAQRYVSRLADDIVRYTVVAATATASRLEDILDIDVSFDQTNIRAVNMMRQNRLRLIREFSNEQREATREALTAGIFEGLNPKQQALAFRDSIGLTRRQQQAVNNYRRLLKEGSTEALTRSLRDRRFDRTVTGAARDGRMLTTAEIDKMVERYRERYIKYRSEVIARTEALRSAHQGTEEMYGQAIENGTLESDRLVRVWLTAKDERVRGSHSAMGGQQRKVGEPFVSGNGYKLMFPGDPSAPASETIQCRCVIRTVFKEDL